MHKKSGLFFKSHKGGGKRRSRGKQGTHKGYVTAAAKGPRKA